MTDLKSTLSRADMLVVGPTILTVDADDTVIKQGAVAVEGNSISWVGPMTELPGEGDLSALLKPECTRLDATGDIMLPGLINCHLHAGDSLFRGVVEDLPLEPWLEQLWTVESAALNPDSAHLGSLLGLIENLEAGATTALDMYFFPRSSLRAARDLGMRVASGTVVFDTNPLGENTVEQARAYLLDHPRADDHIPFVMAHGTYTVPPASLMAARMLARDFGVPFHIHCAETRAEQATIDKKYGTSVLHHMSDLGLLERDTSLAHCVHVDARERALITDSKAHIVHNPVSNLKLGSGFAPVEDFLNDGINVALGTDGAVSGNDSNMWLAMRLAAVLPRARLQDPEAVTNAQALRMATINGAKLLGVSDRIGSLEAGKLADFVLLGTMRANAQPFNDALAHIVHGANARDVRAVYIGGRQRVSFGIADAVSVTDVQSELDQIRRLNAEALKQATTGKGTSNVG